MSHHDTDELVTEALSTLPRQQASDSFTANVLAAVEERSAGNRTLASTTAWAMAAAAVGLIALTVGVAYHRQQTAEEAYRQQVLELRDEYQRLLEEVATVREAATESPARLYLGGDDQLDLVVDLSQPGATVGPGGRLPAARDSKHKPSDIRPAIYEP